MKDAISNVNINILTWNNLKIIRDLYNEYEKVKTDEDYKNIENFVNKNENKLKQINLMSLLLTSKFMDIYLLARLFRKFKQIGYEYPEEPKNIVIYCGLTHAIVFERF